MDLINNEQEPELHRNLKKEIIRNLIIEFTHEYANTNPTELQKWINNERLARITKADIETVHEVKVENGWEPNNTSVKSEDGWAKKIEEQKEKAYVKELMKHYKGFDKEAQEEYGYNAMLCQLMIEQLIAGATYSIEVLLDMIRKNLNINSSQELDKECTDHMVAESMKVSIEFVQEVKKYFYANHFQDQEEK